MMPRWRRRTMAVMGFCCENENECESNDNSEKKRRKEQKNGSRKIESSWTRGAAANNGLFRRMFHNNTFVCRFRFICNRLAFWFVFHWIWICMARQISQKLSWTTSELNWQWQHRAVIMFKLAWLFRYVFFFFVYRAWNEWHSNVICMINCMRKSSLFYVVWTWRESVFH